MLYLLTFSVNYKFEPLNLLILPCSFQNKVQVK